MSAEGAVLAEALKLLAAEAREGRNPEEHPAPEALVAYRAGELAPAEELAIQEHFAHCPHCPGLLLDIKLFLGAAEPAELSGGVEIGEIGEMGMAAAWRRLRDRLAREGLLGPAAAAGRPRWLSGLFVAPRQAPVAYLMSLALLAVTLVLWARVGTLQRELGGLRQPAVSPAQAVDLAGVTRGAEDRCEVSLARDGEIFTLFVDPPEMPPGTARSLAVLSPAGDRVLWESPPWTSPGSQAVVLRRDLLVQGRRLRLVDRRDGRRENVSECSLDVVDR